MSEKLYDGLTAAQLADGGADLDYTDAMELARDLIAAEARTAELERDRDAAKRMMHRIFELSLKRDASRSALDAQLAAAEARIAEMEAKAKAEYERGYSDGSWDAAKYSGDNDE